MERAYEVIVGRRTARPTRPSRSRVRRARAWCCRTSRGPAAALAPGRVRRESCARLHRRRTAIPDAGWIAAELAAVESSDFIQGDVRPEHGPGVLDTHAHGSRRKSACGSRRTSSAERTCSRGSAVRGVDVPDSARRSARTLARLACWAASGERAVFEWPPSSVEQAVLPRGPAGLSRRAPRRRR